MILMRDAQMFRKRFTDEQIALALRQAGGGTPAGGICRKMGVSEATFYRWKKVCIGMGGEPLCAIGPRTMTSEIRRLKQLEDGEPSSAIGSRAMASAS